MTWAEAVLQRLTVPSTPIARQEAAAEPSLADAWRTDVPAAIVVFLIAVPLCLGIALASGAPLFAGIIAGVVGGVVVGVLSGSQLMVSGPAAGLAAVVISSAGTLGSYRALLAATVIAGIFQLLLALVRAGIIGYYFPFSVIRGMLAAIGLILILKQIPHAVGYDADFEGDEMFVQSNAENTFTAIGHALARIEPAAVILERGRADDPAGLGLHAAAARPLAAGAGHRRPGRHGRTNGCCHACTRRCSSAPNTWSRCRCRQPCSNSAPSSPGPTGRRSRGSTPGGWRSRWASWPAWRALLSLEATDRIDPYKREAPLDRELAAQGVGNIVSGLIGGLPVSGVIVRSAANVERRCADQALGDPPGPAARGSGPRDPSCDQPDPAVLAGGHPDLHRLQAAAPPT